MRHPNGGTNAESITGLADRISVLVVDDSAIMRRLITMTIVAEPGLAVVGTAGNGEAAIKQIADLRPDVVILDIEMPIRDGLEALTIIRKNWPQLPVIMCSTLTEHGAAATLDALALGASDYVAKPSGTGRLIDAIAILRSELVPKIRALGPRPQPRTGSPGPAAKTPAIRTHPERSRPAGIDIVAIGVSTGGPNALHTVISSLPGDLPVPVVIVQHMPAMFTTLLADRLNRVSALTVTEASIEAPLRPGHVYIAPGNYHLTLRRRSAEVWTTTTQDPPENSCRPAVDVLFRAVAELFAARTLAVILTGMGQDGLQGTRQISALGGQILAQDEATSVVWGMPGAIAAAGIADALLPVGDIAAEICKRVNDVRPPNMSRQQGAHGLAR